MNDKQKFPWARMMQIGFDRLHLAPAEFWRSTPRELAAAMGAPPQPMLRQNLISLMDLFPDESEPND